MVSMASSSPPPPVPPRKSCIFKEVPYYHPYLKGLEDVKYAMVSYINIEGAFLLRNSFSKPGVYTFSVVHNESLKHFCLNHEDDKYWLIIQKKFHTIDDLVLNYSQEDVPNLEHVDGVRLCLPIPYIPRNVISRRYSESESSISPNTDRLKQFSTSFDSSDMEAMHNGYGFAFNGNGETTLKKTSPVAEELESPVTSPIALRPQLRLPEEVSDVGIGYTRIRDTDTDRLDTLMTQLRMDEEQTLHAVCDCGIYCRDAQLPGGWTVHISNQPDTRNRLFFVGPHQESSWDLPMDIVLEMTQQQHEILKSLRSGRYKVVSHTSMSSSSNMAAAAQ